MRKKIYFSIIALMVSLAVGAQTRESVDLGLPSKTLWATCNVGAEAPEELGDYFAWGETEPNKSEYEWTNYEWCDQKIHYVVLLSTVCFTIMVPLIIKGNLNQKMMLHTSIGAKSGVCQQICRLWN